MPGGGSGDAPPKSYRFVAVICTDENGKFYVKMRMPISGKVILAGPFDDRARADQEVEELRVVVKKAMAGSWS